MTSLQALNGIFDDLENLVRPKDPQGNPLPMATVDVSMDWTTIGKLGLGALLVGLAIGAGNRKLARRKKS